MKKINVIAFILLVIGGLNWGLIGVARFNFVATIFDETEVLIRIVYILFGLSAVWQIFQWKKIRKGSRK
jgi:uncharacterized membrane protein YuzA (DUF378 family)